MLVLFPNQLLKRVSKEIEEVSFEERAVLKRMTTTLEQTKGYGISAIQVGHAIRMFIMTGTEAHPDFRVYINPEITWKSEEIVSYDEGCLSFPNIYAKLWRPKSVKITAQNMDGETFEEELTDFDARCALHELDHLNGITFYDHLGPVQKKMIDKKIRKIARVH